MNGGCLCGAIRYTVDAPIKELRACHCKSCQKASGAGGSVNAVLQSASFTLTQGTPKRYTTVADSGRTLHRYFCGDCGSQLYSQRATTPEVLGLRAGTLDGSAGLKITANIWCASAPSWGYIDPGTTQHPGQPDAPAAGARP